MKGKNILQKYDFFHENSWWFERLAVILLLNIFNSKFTVKIVWQ
jgi:hypothetical protein